MAIKTGAAALLFASQVLPAQCLSVGQFGTWSYINSVVAVTVAVVLWGTDRYCMKSVSLAVETNDHTSAGSDIFASYSIILFNTFLLSAGLWWYLARNLKAELTVSLFGGAILILVGRALGLVSSAVARGRDKVVLSELIFGLSRPLIFVIPLLFIFLRGTETSPERLTFLLWWFGVSFVIVGIVLTVLNSNDAITRLKLRWSKVLSIYQLSFYFLIMGVGVPLLANINTIELGNLRSRDEVSLFAAASKIVSLILLALVSANLLIAPKLSPLFKEGNMQELLRIIRNNNAIVALLTAIPTLVLLLCPEFVISIFKPEYKAGAHLLQWLAFGQVFSVACGPVVLTASLIGLQKQAATTVLVLSGINVVLCRILIPTQGAIGAVIACVTVNVALNGTLAFLIWRKTGLNVTMSNLLVRPDVQP